MPEILKSSTFLKILSREIPWVILCTSDLCFSILTHKPAQPWHALIIPKRPIHNLEEMTPEELAEYWITTAFISQWLKKVYDVPKVWLLLSWFEIAHLHQHAIPAQNWMQISIQKVTDVDIEKRRAQGEKIQAALQSVWSNYKWVPFDIPENTF